MIVNLPSAEALEATAIKLYFRAWHGVVDILHDFDQYHTTNPEHWIDRTDDIYEEERNSYIEGAQEELHANYSIVQQANELALKSRIVAVSPYLLLLNSDVTFQSGGREIEFATMRTLDAVDLPKAVNTLTPTPVSEAYVQRYTQLRVQRNKYTHLGDTSAVLDPVRLCAMMIELYLELWPDLPWWRERVESSLGRQQFFDGKHWSPKQEIMFLLDYDRSLIPAESFKTLFGVKKSAVEFGCFQCQDDWAVRRNGPGIQEAPTSFYVKSKKAMHCVLCDENFDAVLKTCAECGGKFAAPPAAALGAGRCFTCGEDHA